MQSERRKEEYKGRRLGYIVTEQVLDYTDGHGIRTVYLTTDEFRIPAIKLYLRLGFKPVMWDTDMRERWFPILKEFGYNEIYDEDEKLVKVNPQGDSPIALESILHEQSTFT